MTHHMAISRKITDRQDLADIHQRGVGFVLYPFGRKLHAASCPTIPGMALNPKEPRWFAPEAVAARKYQADRLGRYPNAQPFERVRCCASLVPDDAVIDTTRTDRPSPPPRKTTEPCKMGVWARTALDESHAIALGRAVDH